MTLPTQRLRSGAASVPSPLGYDTVRQRGSHVRITTRVNGEHHRVRHGGVAKHGGNRECRDITDRRGDACVAPTTSARTTETWAEDPENPVRSPCDGRRA